MRGLAAGDRPLLSSRDNYVLLTKKVDKPALS
jgi:hypothetical protein